MTGFTLTRDAGTFAFTSGTLTLMKVGESVVGAVVEAPGRFTMTPPDRVEQWQVGRFFDGPTADVELEGTVLLFGPETLEALRGALSFGEPAPGRDYARLLEEGVKFLVDDRSGTVDTEVVRALLNGEGEKFLHAHLKARRGGPYFFRFSTLEAEEVSFGREADGRGDFYETLSAFHRAEDYPLPNPLEETRYPTHIMHYEIESRIDRGPEFSARATAYMLSDLEAGAWVSLSLSPELELDSLRWQDGRDIPFHRREDSGQIWIRLPDDPSFNQLTAWYHGKVVEYRDLWYWLDRPTGWYPRTGRTEATFDMTFHTADRYEFLGSGTRTEETEEDGWVTSRWVIDRPVSQASFNLGDFDEYNREFPGIPPLRLQVNEEFHRRLMAANFFVQEKGAAEAVATDLSGSLSFFQDVYGPIEVKEFNASEIPYGHGQAFPGLIHLSFATFLSQGTDDRDGANEIFRAHEVAHQWWGFSVEPRSYRDRWLSEGLAEFSGLWYMQVVRFDPAAYFKALEDSRERITRRRGKAGPISLGTRVAVGSRDEDYSIIVYDKGAWVIHMLRNLFMDMDTM
ncbi:MAG TPA: M1 family aminopeptidase, partial [Longimicrobiales bacterium]|nr:M1 family aminopeptidase [Longimicrobiales bacterium]